MSSCVWPLPAWSTKGPPNGPDYLQEYRFRVFVTRANGSGLQRVSGDHVEDDAGYPVWSPDGISLIYHVWSRDYTRRARYRVFFDGTAPIRLPPEDETQESILQRTFGFNQVYASPDHQLFAVTSLADEHLFGFWIVTAYGQIIGACATTYSYIHAPTWSPDATAIAFAAADDKTGITSSLYVLERTTGQIRRIFPTGFRRTFCWCPDGQCLAVVAPAEQGGEAVYLVNRDGSNAHHLLDLNTGDVSGEVRSTTPAWSADARYLAISTLTEENDFEIDIYTANGAFVQRLPWPSAALAHIDDLAWQPQSNSSSGLTAS